MHQWPGGPYENFESQRKRKSGQKKTTVFSIIRKEEKVSEVESEW